MKTRIQSLVIHVRGYAGAAGAKICFLDSVSQNVGGFKATMRTEWNSVRIETPALRTTNNGSINDDKNEIVATW
ncbi:MAG: hypothetical protein ACK56W_18600 [Pirellula sp.]|jgi:hypothetical protein|nr:hypothetical protein [Pirellula sp.]